MRVTNEEWVEQFGSIQKLHTGPNGDNPGQPAAINPETGTIEVTPKKAGKQRSPNSAKAKKDAIADALGVKTDSSALDDIDVTGLDADINKEES